MGALAGIDGTADGDRLSDMELLAAIGTRAAMSSGRVTASAGGDGAMSAPATAGRLAAMDVGAGMQRSVGGDRYFTPGALAAMGRNADAGPLADVDGTPGSGMLAGMGSIAGIAALSGSTAAPAMGALAGIAPAAATDNFSVGDALAGQQLLVGRQTDSDLTSRADAARLAYLTLATFGR